MFDRSLIETDSFSDLPMTAKAIYFLLGMEADDEGFVSPKRVVKIYGGSDDDIKVLIAKNFVIPFQSGVVVITDWNNNNWLDNRRVKPTVYQEEKKQLVIDDNKKYQLLSICLASAQPEERSIEEYRGEENNKYFLFNKNTQRPENTKTFSSSAEAQQWSAKNIKSLGEDFYALEVRQY